ncbi:unnamed protein product, partial [Meganyctiphanes norvegica]
MESGGEIGFDAAVKMIRNMPNSGPYQPSHEMMLKFYGLYKQATEGSCSEPKPAFYEIVKGYKWKAWNALGDMPKTDAMATYVEELKKIIETMSYSEDVANFIDVLGPFYEYVDVSGKKPNNNNNIKDSDDSSNEKEEHITNGHIVNGDGASDSESGDSSIELEQTSSTESSPQHLAAQHVEHELCEDSEEMLMVLETTVSHTEPEEESIQAELHKAEEDELEPQLDGSSINDLNVIELENHITLQQGPLIPNGNPVHSLELGDQVLVNNISSMPVSVVQRLLSDTESDEEYSEPAETPDLLVQQDDHSSPDQQLHDSQQNSIEQQTQPPQHQNIITVEQVATSSVPVSVPSSVPEHITHGGGDKSHPGGLQMTPRQTSQSRTFRSGLPRSSVDNILSDGSSGAGYTQAFSGGSGGWGGPGGSGGGRRGSGDLAADVNAQLIVVLRRLQTDMENVLHRLNTLETLTLTHHHSVCLQSQARGAALRSGSWLNVVTNLAHRSWHSFPAQLTNSPNFLLIFRVIVVGQIKLSQISKIRKNR